MKISAILLAGGIGLRMEASTPKQYLPLHGKPVALHSFERLKELSILSEVIVVCDPAYQKCFHNAQFALPGQTRQESLYNGLQKVAPDSEFILTHDAARPLISDEDLCRLIQVGKKTGAATLATPVKATIKEANDTLTVVKTLPRPKLYEIQTPQLVKKSLLIEGFAKAKGENLTVTDDVSLAELVNHPVKLVIGSSENIKITTPEDLTLAEILLHERTQHI